MLVYELTFEARLNGREIGNIISLMNYVVLSQ